MILLTSQRYGAMVPVTIMLEWKDTGSSGKTGREDKVRVMPPNKLHHQQCLAELNYCPLQADLDKNSPISKHLQKNSGVLI